MAMIQSAQQQPRNPVPGCPAMETAGHAPDLMQQEIWLLTVQVDSSCNLLSLASTFWMCDLSNKLISELMSFCIISHELMEMNFCEQVVKPRILSGNFTSPRIEALLCTEYSAIASMTTTSAHIVPETLIKHV